MSQKILHWSKLFMIAVFGVGCTTSAIYTSPTIGISVEYPSDWQIDEQDTDKIILYSSTDSTSSVTIALANNTMVEDPITFLEEISTSSLKTGSLESAETPEYIDIRNYHAAKMRAVTKVSNSYIYSEVLESTDNEGAPITPQTYNVELEFIVVVDGDNAITIIVDQPTNETQRIVESLSFTN